MSSISAGTTTGTALVSTGDTTGQLVLKTNGTTTAVTIGTDQVVTLAQALPVASGGTGAATLTANAVLVGNGTSAVQVVAPGTSGNVLTSNGTTWQSTALPAGGVTSLNGQTGAITNTDYGAIGSYVVGSTTASGTTAYAANDTVAGSSLIVMDSDTGDGPFAGAQGSGSYSSASLSGTWRNAAGYVASGNTLGSTNYRVPTLWVRVS
jgi:hypothetical protein